jgi:prolyl-tRNA synthetase
MRASLYILPTTKEDPTDAVVASHKLMVRAGLIRKSASGLYNYLPLGLRVLQKIENIIREEMNHSGALEFVLPILTDAELWKKSGRWQRMGKEMFRLKDRHEVEYALGPTHEESFSELMKPILKSYKDLPKNVYQIHTKFRDEIRPRFGVIRSREFIMKDAYSFHLNTESLDETYELMRKTYRKIFSRCGLKTIPVQADSGSMGGSGSEEFMVVSPIGEETLTLCDNCGYSGNVEKTPLIFQHTQTTLELPKLEKVHTPNKESIEEVAKFLNKTPKETIKAVYLKADSQINVVVFLRGDRELNEVKLNNFLNTIELRPLSKEDCSKLNIALGYCGPLFKPSGEVKVLYDVSIDPNLPYVIGADELNYHFIGFVPKRDLPNQNYQDFSKAQAGDPCPSCGSPIREEKGIEVGHIFKLGDKYTKAFDIKVSDANGRQVLLTMGCYGIGVNRTMATVIEQCQDEKGIFWPISIAPFEICLLSITKNSTELAQIELIYKAMKERGLEVFWDDRDLGPGFKLKDSELIGFPIRVTLGKKFFENKEYSILNRKTNQEINYSFSSVNELIEKVVELRKKLFEELEHV